MHDATLTLSVAAAAGVILVIAAQRLRFPSIVFLLFGGVLLGPEVLGIIDPESLGEGLETIVSLAVAVILFEGGLTLDLKGYRSSPVVIRRLLTVGPLITWFGTAAAAYWLFGLEFGLAMMAGSLVIVTGPTVVSPLLRRIHLQERLHHILYWEGVLIDVVGVFIAVLCYEWLTPDPGHPLLGPMTRFGIRILIGISLGFAAGMVVSHVLKKEWVGKEYVNIFVLACALLAFGIAHFLLSESGILAVVTAGLVVGLRRPPQLKYVKRFKLQLTELGIGTLFILLSAKLDLSRFTDWSLLFYLAAVMLLIRPLVILSATLREPFELKEKLFLSWLAPRGIVAAAMASLFALRLGELGYPQAEYLETLTYAVIIATVTLQGLSAPALARILRLEQPNRRSWLLIGDRNLVSALGSALRRAGVRVIEWSNPQAVETGLDLEDPQYADVESVLCTDNAMLHNVWPTLKWGRQLGADACYRWASDVPDSRISIPPDALDSPAIWHKDVSAAAAAEGLTRGTHAIDVVELSKREETGRFDLNLRPLFWVKKGRATIVPHPGSAGPPDGDFAIVLRSRIVGLSQLVGHVEVIDSPQPDLEEVLGRLVQSAQRIAPDLPLGDLIDGILERCRTMPVAVGSGIAIPHGYVDGLERSQCVLAAVHNSVSDLPTPDGIPVRLVFLLISPVGQAPEHLRGLAAISSLCQEPQFIELLSRQTVPGRIAALISERA